LLLLLLLLLLLPCWGAGGLLLPPALRLGEAWLPVLLLLPFPAGVL
jgi:hypothetical protein